MIWLWCIILGDVEILVCVCLLGLNVLGWFVVVKIKRKKINGVYGLEIWKLGFEIKKYRYIDVLYYEVFIFDIVIGWFRFVVDL